MLSLYFTTPKVPRIPKEASCYTWTSGFNWLPAITFLSLTVRLSSSSSVRLIGLSREVMLILPERIIFLFLGSVCWWDAMVLSVMPGNAFVLDLLLCSVHRILPVSFAVHHARILFSLSHSRFCEAFSPFFCPPPIASLLPDPSLNPRNFRDVVLGVNWIDSVPLQRFCIVFLQHLRDARDSLLSIS